MLHMPPVLAHAPSLHRSRQAVQLEHRLPMGDFPNLVRFRERLGLYKIADFPQARAGRGSLDSENWVRLLASALVAVALDASTALASAQ